MKKLLSVLFSIITAFSMFGIFATPVQAETYRESLIKQGFPISYVDDLAKLHEKYPNWVFKPFKTDLTFNEAVKGELRNTAANEATLREYLDPRNWFDEVYIFQFESIKRGDSTQTKAGVESILSGTWMNNSLIKYKTTSGADKTYNSTTKYSDALITASKDSGISAYFLASKIKQENGGSKPTANAVSGVKAPFQGIYNYYNIGAYSNASDGLAWAAGYLMTTKSCTLYSSFKDGKPTGTTTALKSGQRMVWRGTPSSNYYYVRLYNGESRTYTEGESGYVHVDNLRTKYFNYGRPWSNPYKSIVNGAKYIADGYLKYQYTMYLQKYNVNKDSGYLYNHEYMTNVNGATNESYHLYTGYKKAGVMASKKTFYIPIYKGLDKDANGCPYISGLKQSENTASSVTLSWMKEEDAKGYYVYKYDTTKKTYSKIATISKNSTNKYTVSNLKAGATGYYAVAAYISKNDKTYTGTKCNKVLTCTKPAVPKSFALAAQSGAKIKVSWKAPDGSCDGYQIWWAKDKSFKNIIAKTNISKKTTLTYTGKNFTKGRTYYIKVRSIRKAGGQTYYSSWTTAKSVKAK